MSYSSPEIVAPVDLCTRGGLLNPGAVGWSRQPLHRCNLSGHWPRKKRWDYWCITTPSFAFSTTIASVDYMGLASAYLIDFDALRCYEETYVTPIGRGVRHGEYVNGDAAFDAGNVSLRFGSDAGGAQLGVRWPGFAKMGLEASIEVMRPSGHETLNVVVPWDAHRFQFTSKQTALPASGHVALGTRRYKVSGGNAFACLDFGRGIWPYRTAWNWASCAARSGSDLVTLNVGAKWTDGTGATENGIGLNGRLSKIQLPVRVEYDRTDFMRPWRLIGEEADGMELDFVPFFDHKSHTNLLILRSDVHQLFGRFTGRVRVGGRDVVLEESIGWAEEHIARW